MRFRIWETKFPIINSEGAGGNSRQINSMKANENLYLNEDKTKVVGEDSIEQAFLLAAEGAEIPLDVVEKYGLTETKQVGAKIKKTANDSSEEPAEEKAKTPAANKAKTPKENK